MVAQPLDDIDGRRASLARDNLIVFAKRLYPGYEPADHLWRIAHALQAIERGDLSRLVITMPPRHGKSELASVHFAAWYLGRNPDARLIGCSYAASLAFRFSRRARNLMVDPRYPFTARPASDAASIQQWDIADHRGGYVAAGVGGAITGMGADVLLIDDPVKSAEEADSEAYRERAWEWFTQTALTRLEPGGAVVLIGTRWHEDDLIGRALAMPGVSWTHIDMPAVTDAGEALWPDRFDLSALEIIREQVGSRAWESLYQQRPSPPEGGILKRHWWRFWHVPGQPLPPVIVHTPDGLVECRCDPLPYEFSEQVQSWDLAFRETSDGSYVVGQTWSRAGANVYLRDQIRERMDFPRTVEAILALARQWPEVGAKYVENKANGPAVISTLRDRIPGLIPVEVDMSKAARANAIAPYVEAGNVYLPHPRIATFDVQALIDECASLPTGAHDDMADALTQAVDKLLKGGSLAEALKGSMEWQAGR